MSNNKIKKLNPLTIFKDVAIQCPECQEIQPAKVEFVSDLPWEVYYHECTKCKHIILESEWDEVENVVTELINV